MPDAASRKPKKRASAGEGFSRPGGECSEPTCRAEPQRAGGATMVLQCARMTLLLALGVNLWVVAVALPMLLAAHAHALGGVSSAGLVLVSLLPLGALAAGRWLARGSAQAWALLVAFPVLV